MRDVRPEGGLEWYHGLARGAPLTEDKDFGRLVYAHGEKTVGVIFLRFPASARRQILRDVLRFVKQHGEKMEGSFVTVQPGRIRISHAPGGHY